MPENANRPIRLGDLLISKGLISPDELKLALVEQKRSGDKLGEVISRMGFLTQEQQQEALGQTLGTDILKLKNIYPDPEAIALIAEDQARNYFVFPYLLDRNKDQLHIATNKPNDLIILDKIKRLLPDNLEIVPHLATESDISKAIDQYYGYELSIEAILRELETGEINLSEVSQGAYQHPIIRLVDSFLVDATKRGASDIHFEPEEHYVRLRYRLDGVLRQVRLLHKSIWSALLVRVKIMADMDLTETRLPQDASMNINVLGRRIDFRVSTQPTLYGENIVLRILDREKGIVPLTALGLDPDTEQELRLMIAKPVGILLVTGPTGSGKTTTLYSILNEQNTMGVNIMTLEDPVEYPMQRIRQTAIDDSVGMTFGRAIRALMRQDPDIILIGEIRDQDTAEMALRAAMTGHQVFSTIHANSALGAIPRLIDIGVSPGLLSGNIIGILAQRLVRKLCVHCKQAYPAEDIEKRLLNQPLEQPLTLYRACGCPKCENSGYKGRTSIIEIVRFNDELDDLIMKGATVHQMREVALAQGSTTLAQAGLRRILQGITDFDELGRVVDLTDLVLQL